jgi:hypothetical protein
MSTQEKILDASSAAQKLTTESKINDMDYKADKILFRQADSFTYNNALSSDIELCLEKTKSNADGFISFNTTSAMNCLNKLRSYYIDNY